jgi:hypothetical protein
VTKGLALATILHDVEARLADALRAAAPALRRHFSQVAVSLTEATDPRMVRLFEDELGASVRFHPTGEGIIGRARREVVGQALALDCQRILYSDVDHILRWLEAGEAEVATILASQPDAHLLIIGRTEQAMQAAPQRLRDTEMPVNRCYELMTGRSADLLFAIRRLDRDVARDLVQQARVDTLANDVEWPLLAERLGYRVRSARAHGLSYRTIDEYGAVADSLDTHPLQWLRRIEMAGEMARAMRPYLP